MRLLVIEDYAPLRESVARDLRDAGYAVDATGDGTEGLWFAENHPYDVILLDLMLPGTPGLEILRRLRATGDPRIYFALTLSGHGAPPLPEAPFRRLTLDLAGGKRLFQGPSESKSLTC